MWRIVGTSVRGTSHIKFDVPCQDYCGYQRVTIGSSSGLIIAIADGAGTAQFSETGARLAVDHLLKIIPSSSPDIPEINAETAHEWLKDTRMQLEATALEQGEE